MGQDQIDQRVGQDHHAHRRGDDDGQDPAQAEGHAMAEGHHVAECPPGGQGRGHRAHHRDGHHAVGELEERVGVGIGRDATGHLGPVGQRQHDHQRHLVGQHPPDGPHGLVGRLPQEPDVQVGA